MKLGLNLAAWRQNERARTLDKARTSHFCRRLPFILVLTLCFINSLSASEKIRFGLNWLPEGEHCGFFQAKAAGLYAEAGLDVELKPGGPDVNTPLLLSVGQLDLALGTSFTTLNMVAEGIPGVTVAAFFQKDPQTLVAHPDQGIATLPDVKGRPVMISNGARQEFWQFLKLKFGFSDSQLRPFTYSAAPFLADPAAIQQGYVTEDALLRGSAMPKPPVILLLADYGFDNYTTTVFGLRGFIDKKREAVHAFVEATRRGFEACMAGDYAAGMKLLLSMNPDHGEPLFHFKLKEMKARRLVDGGDAMTLGVGAMTDERWKSFFDTMAAAGVYSPKLDYKSAYSLEFVKK
jgi:NitT/TauT family transport system substrate-binding protein